MYCNFHRHVLHTSSELELKATVGWKFEHGTDTNFAMLYVGSQSPFEKLSIE